MLVMSQVSMDISQRAQKDTYSVCQIGGKATTNMSQLHCIKYSTVPPILHPQVKSEDGWSSANVAWNEEKLAIVADLFTSFDGAAKTKVLLSFLSMTPRTIIQVCKHLVHCVPMSLM